MKSDRYEYHRFSGGCPVRLEERRLEKKDGTFFLIVAGLICTSIVIFFYPVV